MKLIEELSADVADLNSRLLSGQHLLPIRVLKGMIENYIDLYKEEKQMGNQVRAGHIQDAFLALEGKYAYAGGLLKEDTRSVDANGEARNFSNRNINTSYLVRLEYIESADTTVIYTRNSIYFASGNLIELDLGLSVKHIEGSEAIASAMLNRA